MVRKNHYYCKGRCFSATGACLSKKSKECLGTAVSLLSDCCLQSIKASQKPLSPKPVECSNLNPVFVTSY